MLTEAENFLFYRKTREIVRFHNHSGSRGCDHSTDVQSPFQTRPSVSCGPSEALLELLYQVEDAISEESDPNASTKCTHYNSSSNKMDIESDAIKKSFLGSPIQKLMGDSNDETFLGLEVTERHASSNGSCDHTVKVLRLLNEQTGQERALHLCDKWFYSLVGPGDTIIAIGEFDEQGKCVVDRENNLMIIHPDMLLSGTGVVSSFNYPRRTVLDERLKHSEHSTSALLGTMLHQIFQAGLLKELPTRQFLEEYAGIVLKRNIEKLYSCGEIKNFHGFFGDWNVQKMTHITENPILCKGCRHFSSCMIYHKGVSVIEQGES